MSCVQVTKLFQKIYELAEEGDTLVFVLIGIILLELCMQRHVGSCNYGFVQFRSNMYSMSFSASLQMCSVILGKLTHVSLMNQFFVMVNFKQTR